MVAAVTARIDTSTATACNTDTGGGVVRHHATVAVADSPMSSPTPARQTPKCCKVISNEGEVRIARRYEACRQARLNTSVPFVPPKPKLFFTA